MKICLNSRDLTDGQRSRIEEYFEENFAFGKRRMTLEWKEDPSEYMLLGEVSRDFGSVMFRVHESHLMEIAGRSFLHLV